MNYEITIMLVASGSALIGFVTSWSLTLLQLRLNGFRYDRSRDKMRG